MRYDCLSPTFFTGNCSLFVFFCLFFLHEQPNPRRQNTWQPRQRMRLPSQLQTLCSKITAVHSGNSTGNLWLGKPNGVSIVKQWVQFPAVWALRSCLLRWEKSISVFRWLCRRDSGGPTPKTTPPPSPKRAPSLTNVPCNPIILNIPAILENRLWECQGLTVCFRQIPSQSEHKNSSTEKSVSHNDSPARW